MTEEQRTAPVRDVFAGITDEQWNGDAPYGKGDMWKIGGELLTGDRYVIYCGGGEVVNGVAAKADIKITLGAYNSIQFWAFGAVDPHIRVVHIKVSDGGKATQDTFDSWTDAPRIFDAKYKKYLIRDEFKTEFGRLFIKTIKRALNYSLEL